MKSEQLFINSILVQCSILLKKKFYSSVFFISVGFILWVSSRVFFILWFLSLVFFILWDSYLVFFILVVFIFVGFIFVGYIFVGFIFVGFMFVGFIFVGFIFWDSSCGIHPPSPPFIYHLIIVLCTCNSPNLIDTQVPKLNLYRSV